MTVTEAALPLLRVAVGRVKRDVFSAGLPVLAGATIERLFHDAQPAGRVGQLAVFESAAWFVGAASVPLTDGLEATTRRLYLDVLSATAGLHLARMWNYVPAINATSADGLENYAHFCRGRSLAFEQHHGVGFQAFLPAASAVGCTASELTVVFAACRRRPQHIENPLQVPAYRYPLDYGPRPPAFARATIAPHGELPTIFISGTAAIRGHCTVAPHRTSDQLECTLENLHGISRACGLGDTLGAEGSWARQFKIYLRHREDLSSVASTLRERLLRTEDSVSYLHSDICRAQLNVEIEASLWPRSITPPLPQ